MDSVKIIGLIVVLYMLCMLLSGPSKSSTSTKRTLRGRRLRGSGIKGNKPISTVNKSPNNSMNTIVDSNRSEDLDSNSNSSSGSNSSAFRNNKLNPNFLDNQFSNDYRDVISGLNNLVPERKQLFNLPNIPLVYSEPEPSEVKNMVKDFVNVLNYNLSTEVPECRNKNTGWDEPIVDPTVKSGWNKVQAELGLPEDLYNDPAKKAPVRIVAVPYVQKYETEDEIKYSVDLVLQKDNVDDQMVIKADFVQDKRPLLDENNFFTTRNIQMKVTIENIFITGYLSNKGTNTVKQFDGDQEKYYEYDKLEQNNMTDPKFVQKVLMEKYAQRNDEMEQRTAMLDEEGQAYHRSLPQIYDFDNIKNSRSIYDDMNYSKQFV